MSEFTCPNDIAWRKKVMVQEAFRHPAKMNMHLCDWLVRAYTHIGDVIVDPMAGIGTTLIATLRGRNVILVELEEKFAEICRLNWKKMVYSDPRPTGWAGVLCADSRYLVDSVGTKTDVVLFSPPYAKTSVGGGLEDGYKGTQTAIAGYSSGRSGKTLGQVSNMIYDRDYKDAMLQIYQSCFTLLKKDGVMVLVTKDFLRDQRRVYLSGDTITLCGKAGFELTEHHTRRLTAMSFWRRNYYNKFPDADRIFTEDILVFRKVI